ncbi:phosphate-starvation-inducible protein PsiE [Paenibacillus xerothermodurans]|uniref:Protein PsiE n=1 Tax=Paenibacillus xerothermodurans TaxID=1977292 RepID=A0A2W1N9A9_PAEXE|nr:phosphate-starvation-inducible protein PsiE [Paenibacillus xerothermodurans]PZE20250.1 phosphate-starvation-inducible protein PsiE [Paenibacillus xerothermodurans]
MAQQNRRLNIAAILQTALNTALILLALTLCILLAKELVYFMASALLYQGIDHHYELLERILIFFLYFEFIVMIVKYFQEGYHFPLRYFLYIGMTAMLRLIIVDHDSPVDTLLYACAILVLIVSFFVINSVTARRHKL